jgi:hypothetical protein
VPLREIKVRNYEGSRVYVLSDDLIARNEMKIFIIRNFPFIQFNDDDFALFLFTQMRYTKKVSMWPVGLITKFGVSTPIVKNGTITGFYDGWIGGRKFPGELSLSPSCDVVRDLPRGDKGWKLKFN